MNGSGDMLSDRISVVIPTLDGAGTIGDVLDGLEEQRGPFEVEVVLVDTGSRDATLAIAKRRNVRVYSMPPETFNHGETRNFGIQQTRGDPIVLMTQDAIPGNEHLLMNLARPFENPRVAGVYGRQIPRKSCDVATRRQLENSLTGRETPALSELGDTTLSQYTPAERHRLCTFDNVCSAVRRSLWQKQPFPRADWGEDVEWGKLVLTSGWAIAYEPTAAVYHSHRRSIAYEYRRTRIGHRRLHELFGLETVPYRRSLARAVLANLRRDVPYVLRNAPSAQERIRQLLRVAGLSLANPLAQYRGARAARRSQNAEGRR